MVTEPTKAAMGRAMERAKKICDGVYRMGVKTVTYAFALELDRIDRVAREIGRIIDACHGVFPTNAHLRGTLLASLMLPEEPDPLEHVWSTAIDNLQGPGESLLPYFRAALAEAGLKIVKDEA